MKKKITEADKPTKTKTPDIIDMDIMNEPTGNLPASQKNTNNDLSGPQSMSDLKKADASKTARDMARLSTSDEMRRYRDMIDFGALDAIDVPDDGMDQNNVVAYEPVTPDMVPAVIRQDIAKTGDNSVNPDWYAVSELPGNYHRVIRLIGKQLFADFTTTPTEKIVMIGTVGGQGPSNIRDVNAVKNWVEKNGHHIGDANIDFSQINNIIPNYTATSEQYSYGNIRYNIVKDFMGGEQVGVYVYAWPEADSLQHKDTTKSVGNNAIQRLPRR